MSVMVTTARDGGIWRLGTSAEVAWLVSALWDDDRMCVGGTADLVDGFLRHPALRARPVALGQDAAPPGHRAR